MDTNSENLKNTANNKDDHLSSNNSKNQLAKNIFSLTIVQVSSYALPLISVPIISRIIGPSNYGIINFAAVFIAYFNLMISYGFDLTATRKIAKDPFNEKNRNTVFSEVFYTQCLLFIFATIVFIILLLTVPQLKAHQNVFVFSYLICLGTLFTQNWLFQAMQDISLIAFFNLFSKIGFTVAILIVVQKIDDYVWQPLVISISQIIVAISCFMWAIKTYKIKFIKIPLKRCFAILWEERTIFFSLVVVNLYTTTNTFILGLYQNSEQVGFYTAGQRLIIIAQSVLTMPLTMAFYPYIGKAFGENREAGLKVTQKLIPLIILFIGLASVIMFILGPFVISTFYGNKFTPAIPVFQILTLIPLIGALSNVFGIQIMLNLRMDKLFFRITTFGAILSILLNFMIIRRWGFIATAINWLVTELFIMAAMYISLKRRGINPLNIKYFSAFTLNEYMRTIRRKLFAR